MPTTDPISAVVVSVTLPRALERVRRRHDVAAASGAPAHVTLLFPFLPVTRLEPPVRRELAEIARGVTPFEVRLAVVRRFPGIVYLAPEPIDPFVRLTTAIAAQFPDYPPYGGTHPEIIPHLTLAQSDEARLDALALVAQKSLPFARRVRAIQLLVEDTTGRWRTHWRIPLGVRS